MTAADLFAASGEPPVLDPAPDFLRCFLAELRNGPTAASRVRQKHGIPGSPYTGIIIHALYCAGIIEPVEYVTAVTPESQSHIERVWRFPPKPEGVCR